MVYSLVFPKALNGKGVESVSHFSLDPTQSQHKDSYPIHIPTVIRGQVVRIKLHKACL